MSVHWMWDWGINLPVADYVTSDWDFNATSQVDTANTANVFSPIGSASPGDRNVLALTNLRLVTSKPFEQGAIAKGWAVVRCQILAAFGIGNNPIFELLSGSTTKVKFQRVSGTASAISIGVYTGTTLVGTATTTIDVTGSDVYVFALKFDLSVNPNQAGLWIDGTEEVALGAGFGAVATVDRVQYTGQGSSTFVFGTTYVLNSHDTADNALGAATNVWSTTLRQTSAGSTSEWSLFGGAADYDTALADGDGGTGLSTATTNATLEVGYEDRNEVLSGWAPTVIHAIQGVAYAGADTINQGSFTIDDDTGTVITAPAQTLTSSPNFIVALATQANGGGALVGADLDALLKTYIASA